MTDQEPVLPFKDMFIVGITGHREISDPAVVARLTQEVADYFAALCLQHAEVCVLSQLAVGADTIIVESAVAQGIHHVVVVPFVGYEEDFEDDDRSHFRELRDGAFHVHHLQHSHRSDAAYFDAGKWIVEQSNALLAAWDGEAAHGTGGTGDIVAYAQAIQKPVFVIDTPR